MDILYEDSDLLVLNKPAGMVVNPAETVKEETVQEWIQHNFKFPISNIQYPIEEKDFYERAGIVHRLDKDTSGCLVVAKNPDTFAALQAQFKERTIEKRYLALVHGKVTLSEGTIVAPVGRLPWNRQRFGVFPGGREAETSYQVKHYYHYNDEDLTLLILTPKSGRTHQIRAHLKYINHSIVSDPWYTGDKRAKADQLWCPRLFLHAQELHFTQPTTGKRIEVVAPLPEDLQKVLAKLPT